ncbi:hypothetical protein ACFU7Y_36375 [Kitasatospora sp. NPDC057542]|uniref:hypothetical protein n=1 Tax=Kitasatospora sp. NPDC057542 TaxID=3346162 RepID=UPI0036BC77CD
MLADAKMTCADLSSEEAHQVRNRSCTVGAVVTPRESPSEVIVEWFEDGATDEAALPARRVQTVRSMRNRVLDECVGLLRDSGFTVALSESSRTRTRRLQSLLVSGEPHELAKDLTQTLAQYGLSRAGVLPSYWEIPDLYRIVAVSDALALTFSHATQVERVRDAIAVLRAQGLNANEDAPSLYGVGYGVLVRENAWPAGERDGLSPETTECQAARDLLWTRGFSHENPELGTIGHRVHPPTDLAALYDRVSVTAADTAYAEGHGRELATALSAAHAVAFTAAGWSVVREDPTTITVCRSAALRAAAASGPNTAPTAVAAAV